MITSSMVVFETIRMTTFFYTRVKSSKFQSCYTLQLCPKPLGCYDPHPVPMHPTAPVGPFTYDVISLQLISTPGVVRSFACCIASTPTSPTPVLLH